MGGAGLQEVRLPLRLELSERQPEAVSGDERLAKEPEPDLVWLAVLLARVAPAAGGHDVLPGVLAAPRLGDHVVDVFRRRPAVLAPPVVAGEHRSAGQRGAGPIRDVDEVPQL